MAVFAFAAVGAVMILAVLLIVVALVFYLVSVILALRKITAGLDEAIAGVSGIVEKSAPVAEVVTTINQQLDAGVELLEGLLVKKAGMSDAIGLVEGLYAGSAAAGFRSFPDTSNTRAPRIGEVYTKGTLTLARLGREAPIATANPTGALLRDVERGSLAARSLYPEARQTRPSSLSRSPVIGSEAPVQYEQREDIGAPRKHLPARRDGAAPANPGSASNAATRPGSGTVAPLKPSPVDDAQPGDPPRRSTPED